MDGTVEHHLKLMRFLQSKMLGENIYFMFCGSSCSKEKISSDQNAFIVPDFYHPSDRINHFLKSCKKIIVVGLFDSGLIFYLNLHFQLLKKVVVVFHGGEFYSIRGKLSLKAKLFQFARKRVVSGACACYTFTHDDYEFAKEYYNLPKKHGCVELPWHYEVTPDYALPSKPNSPFVILVGHNARIEDHHEEVLNKLAQYKNENIRIIAPLSYGSKEIRDQVIKKGTSIFGERFVPLTEWIEPSRYQKMLQTVSVFVLGTDRQAGTFNVNLMLRLGAKVFLRKDNSLWSYYSRYCNCKIFDISTIDTLSFKEFVTFSKDDRVDNSKNISCKLTPESCLKSWYGVINL